MKKILVDARNTLFTEDGIFEEMYNLLEEYDTTKIVVTNANDEQMKTFGIDKSPYKVFTLKHNPDKIDPIYWDKLMEKYNLTTSDMIYFEHNKDAVKSASSVGITTYHYDNNTKNLINLRKFLDENINKSNEKTY